MYDQVYNAFQPRFSSNLSGYLKGHSCCSALLKITEDFEDANYYILLHSYTNKLANITNAYQLEQIFKEPTRVTENPKSLIDLIFSNKPELIIKSGGEHVGICDHSLIYMHRKISIPTTKDCQDKAIQYKYYNNQLFKSDLRKIFTNNIYQSEDPNELWNDSRTRFLMRVNTHLGLQVI